MLPRVDAEAAAAGATWEGVLRNILGDDKTDAVMAAARAQRRVDADARRYTSMALGNETTKKHGVADPFTCPMGKSAGKPGCVLGDEQRIDLRRLTGEALSDIKANFQAAVSAVERDRLARARGSDGTGWKMLINVFFSLGTRGLGTAVAGLFDRYRPVHQSWKMVKLTRHAAVSTEDLEAYRKSLAAARQDAISMTMSSLGRAARASALARAKAAGARGAEPSALIGVMENNLQAWKTQASTGLRKLDDYQLLAVHAHLDPGYYDKAYFIGRIESLLEQVTAIGTFRSQGVFNRPVEGTLKQAVRIRAHGQTRMALCYAPQTPAQRKEHSGMPDVPWRRVTVGHNLSGRYTRGDLQRLSETLKRARFIRWIDDDLAGLAAEANRLHVGEVLTFDLSDGRDADKLSSGVPWQDGYYGTFQGPNKEVARWVEQARRAAKGGKRK